MDQDEVIREIMAAACNGAGRAAASHWGVHWMRCLGKGFREKFRPDDVIIHVPGGPRTVIIGSVRKKEMVFDLLVAGWEKEAIPDRWQHPLSKTKAADLGCGVRGGYWGR